MMTLDEEGKVLHGVEESFGSADEELCCIAVGKRSHPESSSCVVENCH